MPRFPTIRVIGSHDMSTMLPASGLISSRTAIVFSSLRAVARLVAGRELTLVVPPFRFLVGGLVREAAQLADHWAVDAGHQRRCARARRLVHERHELVGE